MTQDKQITPTPDRIPDDIACWLGGKLLAVNSLTQSEMVALVRSARNNLKRRELSSRLRDSIKDCLADCGQATRGRIRGLLDEFDKLEEKGKT